MGLPSYLGALFIVGLPAVITGVVTAIAKRHLEGWAVWAVAALTFIVALLLWMVAIYYIEEWRDKTKVDAQSSRHDPSA